MRQFMLLLPLLTACGVTCEETCNRLYGTLDNQCAISQAGTDAAQLADECVSECQIALEQPGEIGNYDPYERASSTGANTLENEQQAALWMQCVETTACELIKEGFCTPW